MLIIISSSKTTENSLATTNHYIVAKGGTMPCFPIKDDTYETYKYVAVSNLVRTNRFLYYCKDQSNRVAKKFSGDKPYATNYADINCNTSYIASLP